MIDKANGFMNEGEQKAREFVWGAPEVITLVLTAGLVAAGGGSLLLMLAII
jgi:hypothetical protein